MMKRKGILVIAGALAFAAAVAFAEPGSLISSFLTGNTGNMPFGAYRDENYVYVFYYDNPVSHYALKYTPAGEYVGITTLWHFRYLPEDPDHSILGSSYFTVAAERGIVTYAKEGGTSVRWDHRDLIETLGYAYNPGSPYYFVAVWPDAGDIIVYRFNTGGSLVSTFATDYGAKLAAPDRFAGMGGDYLITYGGSVCAVYEPAGSLITTFNHNAGYGIYGGTAGPGYPASYGTTLWALLVKGTTGNVVCQIDLGNGSPSAVAPASLGKVKALFR
jgi:hypothetical protein